MTYALRGARSLTGHALAAPIAWIIALTALAALGLSGVPFHEPFHARGSYPATVRNVTGGYCIRTRKHVRPPWDRRFSGRWHSCPVCQHAAGG